LKFLAKMVVLAFAINLLCSGCGTGMTIVEAALTSPTISQVSPQVVTAGTPSVTVTVQGANFQSQAALTVNGAEYERRRFEPDSVYGDERAGVAERFVDYDGAAAERAAGKRVHGAARGERRIDAL
jgi:uncharacterized protein YceK